MNEMIHTIAGKEFTHSELAEAFDNTWNTLKRGTDRSAESKVRAAKFCLSCVDAGVVSDKKAASVTRVCGAMLKAVN